MTKPKDSKLRIGMMFGGFFGFILSAGGLYLFPIGYTAQVVLVAFLLLSGGVSAIGLFGSWKDNETE